MPDNQIMTLEDVAKIMKVSLKTVYRWVSARKLRAAKIGHKTYRVLEKDLIQFVNDHIDWLNRVFLFIDWFIKFVHVKFQENSKFKITNSKQISNLKSKIQNVKLKVWNFEHCNLFGICNLEFVI